MLLIFQETTIRNHWYSCSFYIIVGKPSTALSNRRDQTRGSRPLASYINSMFGYSRRLPRDTGMIDSPIEIFEE